MDPDHLWQIIQPMLVAFKQEVANMRSEGATQAEIDEMLDELERVHGRDDKAEGKLIMALLKLAARPPS